MYTFGSFKVALKVVNIFWHLAVGIWVNGTNLMERSQAIHVRRIDVSAHFQQALDLVLVPSRACRQKHDPRRELDPRSTLRRRRLFVGIGFLPSLQLLGPLEQRR